MKKIDSFWKIAFVIVVILVIGSIYMSCKQEVTPEVKQEVQQITKQQEKDLRAYLNFSCSDYNRIAITNNEYLDYLATLTTTNWGDDFEIYDCKEYYDIELEDMLENLLEFCALRRDAITTTNDYYDALGFNRIEQDDCNLVVQSYNGIMSR